MADPAKRIAKVVALATSANEHEAQAARDKALKLVAELDLDLLTTLAGQRDALIADLDVENRRLISSRERANKRTTGDLVSRARMLLHHYQRVDALISIVALLQGRTPPEAGPDFLTRYLGDRYREDHDKWREKV